MVKDLPFLENHIDPDKQKAGQNRANLKRKGQCSE